MAKKAQLVCKPCGYSVAVSDLGSAVVECWECGVELEPAAKAQRKAIAAKAATKKLPAKAGKKAAAKKPAARKAAPKKKK